MKLWQITIINVGIIIVSLLAITFGSTYSVPDLVMVSYGFPLTWGINTTNTIAGPANIWSVNVWTLTMDLLLWFIVLSSVNLIVSMKH